MCNSISLIAVVVLRSPVCGSSTSRQDQRSTFEPGLSLRRVGTAGPDQPGKSWYNDLCMARLYALPVRPTIVVYCAPRHSPLIRTVIKVMTVGLKRSLLQHRLLLSPRSSSLCFQITVFLFSGTNGCERNNTSLKSTW